MMKEDIEKILTVLGTDGILDTLISVREMKWATASEVADKMNIHVATAVKRLSGLYEIGILDRRVRKGRTRSAQEYSLISSAFGLDIDLDELAGIDSANTGSEIYLLLLKDMVRRFGKFSGRNVEEIISAWKIQKILENEDTGIDEIIGAISDALESESEEYGELTVRSLAAASLDAVGQNLDNLPERFFEVKK